MKESDEKERSRWNSLFEAKRTNKTDNLLNEKQLDLLEFYIERDCYSIIFNSEKDDWSMKKSIFFEKLKNKSHFAIIIETTEGKEIWMLH